MIDGLSHFNMPLLLFYKGYEVSALQREDGEKLHFTAVRLKSACNKIPYVCDKQFERQKKAI